MRSDNPRSALLDIFENIRLACQFVAGMDYETFLNDRRTVYAVIRRLENCFGSLAETAV